MQKINIKNRLKEIIDNQPDDATYAEILRELAFELMVERGLDDSKNKRTISNKDMGHRIKTW
ncbi:MAG: hypothetical protein ACTSVZ_05705 [Promethearchaeota archaeon]